MTIATPDVIIDGFSLENTDNVTHLLVAGLTAELNQDLDVDDDGVLDDMYWTELVDSKLVYKKKAMKAKSLNFFTPT